MFDYALIFFSQSLSSSDSYHLLFSLLQCLLIVLYASSIDCSDPCSTLSVMPPVAHCCEQMNTNLLIIFSLIFLLGIAFPIVFKVLFLDSVALLILSTLYETDYSHPSSSNIFQLYPLFPHLQVISSCHIFESSPKAFLASKCLS